MAVTKKSLIKYTLLPEFWPRLRTLAGSGFIHIAYLMAVIYSAARLLPPDHPYLQQRNMGRYTIRNVMSEAANNLIFTKGNIDQIIIFFLMLAGAMLLVLQFIILVIMLITQPAVAGLYTNLIGTNIAPGQDIAFMVLDRVFGVQDIFNSCIADTTTACIDRFGKPISTPSTYPFPIHTALHKLLAFYSTGIAVIGIVMILYFVVTTVGETATSGTPFGKRYNKAWVPIRIVIFFALITPLSSSNAPGLNGAQFITFYTAKLGSNLATNGWVRFNEVLTGATIIDVNSMIAYPNIPEIGGLNKFFFFARVCKFGEEMAGNTKDTDVEIKPYLVRGSSLNPNAAGTKNYLELPGTYEEALTFSEGGTITIRFGELDPAIAAGEAVATDYEEHQGNVFPNCGEIQIHPTSLTEPGALAAQGQYYELIKELWDYPEHTEYAECFLNRNFPMSPTPNCTKIPDLSYISGANIYANDRVRVLVGDAIANNIPTNQVLPEGLKEKGWGGAAIWYNRIAEMNGAVTSAIFAVPIPNKYPYVMEEAARQHRMENENISGSDLYSPRLANHMTVKLPRPYNNDLLVVLYAGYKLWGSVGGDPRLEPTGNMIIDAIHMIFGTKGLLDIKNNATSHPLAQISALGRGMIEASIRNVLISTTAVVGNSLLDVFENIPALKGLINTASGFLSSIVSITLLMGITLYYVLPFLPFIYFMFALSGWIKSIFEAIVAMPLWALAHIHIDGDGVPGQYASNGYFLLLEIFLRPLLIVFGLLASISIFSALVVVLNQVFDLVVSNVGGVDLDCAQDNVCSGDRSALLNVQVLRGPIDQFFMTAMYTMIVYMIGLGCFKLIDQIPNNLMRWMGVSTKSFQEEAGNISQQISGKMYKGSQITISQFSGGMSGGQVAALTQA